MYTVPVVATRINLLATVKAWCWEWAPSSGKRTLMVNSGDIPSLFRETGTPRDASTEDPSAVGAPQLNAYSLPGGGKLVIGDITQLLPSPQADFEPKDVDKHGLTVTTICVGHCQRIFGNASK